MNKPVIITADSSADLPPEIRERYGIHIFPLYINLEGKFYKDCVDIFPADIYAAYDQKRVIPKTAAPSIGEYQAFFQQFTSQGFAVVHISLDHQLSSCFRIALLAAEEMRDVYPVDSMNFCVGQGMLTCKAAKLRDAGLAADEIAVDLTVQREKIRSYYLADSLEFIKKGGRCSAIQAFGANLLGIRPSIVVDGSNGDLIVGKKYRNKRPVVQETFIRDAIAAVRTNLDTSMMVISAHTPDMLPAQYEPLDAIVKAEMPEVSEIATGTLGCVITSHVGKQCLAVIAMEK
ncbi:MAG: DegV family protein [Oscillospiraceae bacterium]|nr:DegV family protein [Oscillospiraceae bacterium]